MLKNRSVPADAIPEITSLMELHLAGLRGRKQKRRPAERRKP